MAVVTTHLLNAVLGTHASGVCVSLTRIQRSGSGRLVFERETDEGGRLSQTVVVAEEEEGADYELVFQTGKYFESTSLPRPARQVLKEVVIRFAMPDPDAVYHIPLMIAPNSYSVWWSA